MSIVVNMELPMDNIENVFCGNSALLIFYPSLGLRKELVSCIWDMQRECWYKCLYSILSFCEVINPPLSALVH